MVLPASADEGHLVSPDMYDEAEIVEAYDMPAIFTKGVRETYLGSYTIQNYLGAGYMKFTNESFGKDKFNRIKLSDLRQIYGQKALTRT